MRYFTNSVFNDSYFAELLQEKEIPATPFKEGEGKGIEFDYPAYKRYMKETDPCNIPNMISANWKWLKQQL